MTDKYKTAANADYEVKVHHGFASKCTVTRSGGAKDDLYVQTERYDCGDEGHPTEHEIVLTERSGDQRTVTIVIKDPSHMLHGISLDLYEQGRDPMVKKEWKSKDTVTVLNSANTCPPYCEG